MQTKDPHWFYDHTFPDNVILAVTIETNRTYFETPSFYMEYRDISNAPHPMGRYYTFIDINHPRKIVTVEPVLQFILNSFVDELRELKLEAVYVGYDNHNCKLPEPRLSKTKKLISELEKFTEVRVKSLRKAWYEK